MDLHNEGRQHVMNRMGEIGQTLSAHAQVCIYVIHKCLIPPFDRSMNGCDQLNPRTTPTYQRRVVSLGDLGAYGEAGTTASFELAKDYLDGFGLGYNLVTGNHDLEGMEQFDTDLENLIEWQRVFGLKWVVGLVECGCAVIVGGLVMHSMFDSPSPNVSQNILEHTHTNIQDALLLPPDRREDALRGPEHHAFPLRALFEP